MKSRFQNKIKTRLLIFFAILCIAFIINSCRKDGKTVAQTSSTSAISQAKTWYENTYPVTGSLNSNLITQSTGGTTGALFDFSQFMRPDWLNAATYARLGKNVIEMPIASGVDFGYDFNNKTANKIYSDKKYNRSYFLLLNDGKGYQAYVMEIMADSAYVNNDMRKLSHNSYRRHDPDFTGMVAYFTPKGQYVSGAAFVDGQVVTAGATTQPANGKVVQSANTGTLNQTINTTTTAPVCTDWYADFYINGKFWYSEFLGTTCTGGSPAPPSDPTGGGVPPPPPCQTSSSPAPESVGHLTIDVTEPPPPGSGDGGMPPPQPCPETNPATVIIDTTQDPCARRTAINAMAANAVIAKQDSTILSKTVSGGLEYGVNQNLNSLTGNSFFNTSVTAGTTTTWQPTFTWDNTNGYTLGYSHGHPDGNPPSPQDVIDLVNPIGNNHELISAGQSAIQFYETNASVTSVTTNGTYLVTINNWTTMKKIFSSSYSTPAENAASLAIYENDVKSYLTNVQDASPADASAYALMQVFQNSVTIYYAPPGSTNFMPLTTTIVAGNNVITALPCP